MFDSETSHINLSNAFMQVAGRSTDLLKHPIAIPDQREPEISFLLGNGRRHRMELAHAIHDRLSAARGFKKVVGSERDRTDRLVSMNLDTVDAQNIPTRLVRAAGLTKRTRFSMSEENGVIVFGNFDHSVKTTRKDADRREYEAHSNGLSCDGEHLLDAYPVLKATLGHIDPINYRVSSICITARAAYNFIHFLPDGDTAVLYDICHDGCIFSTQYADHPLGYRTEFESEAKMIYSRALNPRDYAAHHEVLDQSLEQMTGQILDAGTQELRLAHESKMDESERVAGEFYQSRWNYPDTEDGINFALTQGIRPEHFEDKKLRSNIFALGQQLPSSQVLLPSSRLANYDVFFDPARLGQYRGQRPS